MEEKALKMLERGELDLDCSDTLKKFIDWGLQKEKYGPFWEMHQYINQHPDPPYTHKYDLMSQYEYFLRIRAINSQLNGLICFPGTMTAIGVVVFKRKRKLPISKFFWFCFYPYLYMNIHFAFGGIGQEYYIERNYNKLKTKKQDLGAGRDEKIPTNN